MTIIPCELNANLRQLILDYSEALKTQAHLIGNHGLSERQFYDSGLFRGAIERLRGQFSATMRDKWDFAQSILTYMQDRGLITNWQTSGSENRHDYTVTMPTGRVAVIELKGCLDGNNTNIFERPPHANEFIIWSLCTNPGADPRLNARSGIHTRLSAEIISRAQRVDGLIIWDMVCGTIGRPCPKIAADPSRITNVAHYQVPPPCIYLFPATIPSPRNNPSPSAQPLKNVEIFSAFAESFKVRADELYAVNFSVAHAESDTVRTTTVQRNGVTVHQSGATAIRRT